MKAVIFDRDGVIIDSESVNVDSAVEAFRQLGIKIKEKEKQWIVGRPPDDYKEFFLEKYDFSYKNFREIQEGIYQELLNSVPFLNETISLIKRLKKDKTPLALTTSSTREGTLQILKKGNLENTFDVIVTCEDCKYKKPHPESYLTTSEKLDVSPKDCIAVEDSSVGIEAAKRAGMKCIALPNSYTEDQDLSQADLRIDSAEKIDMDLLEWM